MVPKGLFLYPSVWLNSLTDSTGTCWPSCTLPLQPHPPPGPRPLLSAKATAGVPASSAENEGMDVDSRGAVTQSVSSKSSNQCSGTCMPATPTSLRNFLPNVVPSAIPQCPPAKQVGAFNAPWSRNFPQVQPVSFFCSVVFTLQFLRTHSF